MITCIIPSRINSSRFYGKSLYKINGKELILHVCDIAKKSKFIDQIIVASEDDEICQLVSLHGYSFIKTDEYTSCTEKVSNASKFIDSEYIINFQGDEPCVDPEWIDEMIKFSLNNKYSCVQATYKLSHEDISDVDCVKCLVNNGHVVYLDRNLEGPNILGISGVYFYEKSIIENFINYDLSLINYYGGLDTFGFIGKVPVVPYIFPKRTHAVDRIEDIKKVEEYLK